MQKIVLVLVLIPFLPVCASGDQQVDVQVFIVTRGGDNVKLGLVSVGGIPLEEAKHALRPVIARRDDTVAKLYRLQAERRKQFEAALQERETGIALAKFQSLEAAEALSRAERQFGTALEAAAAAADAHARQRAEAFSRAEREFGTALEAAAAAAYAHSRRLEATGSRQDLRRAIGYMKDASSLRACGTRAAYEEALAIVSGDRWLGTSYGRNVWAAAQRLQQATEAHDPHRAVGYMKDASSLRACGTRAAYEEALAIVSGDRWLETSYGRNVCAAAQGLQYATEAAERAAAEARDLESSRPPIDDSSTAFKASVLAAEAPALLVAALPRPSVVAKTDADGRCTLRLPGAGPWVLAATGGREVGGKREEYFWIVPLPEGRPAGQVLLSNDNLLTPGANPFPF